MPPQSERKRRLMTEEMLSIDRAEFIKEKILDSDMFVGTPAWCDENDITREEYETLIQMAVQNVKDRGFSNGYEFTFDFLKGETKKPGEPVRCTIGLEDSDVSARLAKLCMGGPVHALVVPTNMVVDAATGEVI